MRIKTVLFLLVMVTLFLAPYAARADMEWEAKAKLELEETPIDMTFSKDGRWFYLLTTSGNLLVYSSQGAFNGKAAVGKGFDHIEAGPTQEDIYLLNSKDKSIQVIELSYTMDIDISESPYKGAPDAPIVIVEYTDFQCPYCARLGNTLDEMLKLYPGKIKIVYKSFPLNSHKYSVTAAAAAVTAHEKGKFWEFYKRLFENYSQLNDEKIKEIRNEFGFDTPDFEALMASDKVRARIFSDQQEGIILGVHSTPTVFINGKRLKNKRPDGFKEAIENELKNFPKP